VSPRLLRGASSPPSRAKGTRLSAARHAVGAEGPRSFLEVRRPANLDEQSSRSGARAPDRKKDWDGTRGLKVQRGAPKDSRSYFCVHHLVDRHLARGGPLKQWAAGPPGARPPVATSNSTISGAKSVCQSSRGRAASMRWPTASHRNAQKLFCLIAFLIARGTSKPPSPRDEEKVASLWERHEVFCRLPQSAASCRAQIRLVQLAGPSTLARPRVVRPRHSPRARSQQQGERARLPQLAVALGPVHGRRAGRRLRVGRPGEVSLLPRDGCTIWSRAPPWPGPTRGGGGAIDAARGARQPPPIRHGTGAMARIATPR
jgi:hypothetical protein